MNIEERKLKILQAIINNYIINAEPVGSRTISKKYDLGISSATIRNEMSDLEELGYLLQPHTSAGRIPSDKAYRLYVNNLLKLKKKALINREQIKKGLLQEISEIEQVIQNSAKILSKLTHYTSLAIAPQLKQSKLKHIQLVPVDETKVLVVIVTNSGIVKNAVFRLDEEIPNDQLYLISNLLTERLKGRGIGEIGLELKESFAREIFEFNNTIEKIIPLVNQTIDSIEEIEFYTDGVTNIFNFPEYNDIARAKKFISFLEDKRSMVDMLLRDSCKDIEISIGNENYYEEIKNCSLITATYKLNGRIIGKIGIIGPTRMDYSTVIPVVKSIAIDINEILEKYFLK